LDAKKKVFLSSNNPQKTTTMFGITDSKTKIIATLGPASQDRESLKKMINEGLDVFRLNFSHGKHDDKKVVIKTIRALEEEMGVNIAILADLQGPKIRIGDVENNGVLVENGAPVEITTLPCIGTAEKLFINYEFFARDVEPGSMVLIDDGKIRLEVMETDRNTSVKTRVVNGGIVSSKKGVNLPNTGIALPSLTEKDIVDAEFAIKNSVDWIALSFVRNASDLRDLKSLIKKHNADIDVIAKVEKPEAVADLDNIIAEANGIMVARGDLGVEVSFNQVPTIQKLIVEKCIKAGKPVIIATQMLESMITNFRPTRAEATDVANAVIDRADALMLSGETSVGAFPVESIKAMQSIIEYTEENNDIFYLDHQPDKAASDFLPDSICHSAGVMAKQTGAKAIVAFTYSGHTAFQISSYRPKADIYAFTGNKRLLRRLPLLWGIIKTYSIPLYTNIDEAIAHSIKILKSQGVVQAGDLIIHVGSTPMTSKNATNMLKLTRVD